MPPDDEREDRGEEPEPAGGRAAERRRQFERSRGLTEGGELDLEPPKEGSDEEEQP